MWIIAVAAAVPVLATGLLPVQDATQVVQRIAPVLGFLVAVTVLAELADEAQVFQVAADQAARITRGSVVRLFAVVCLLATVSTVLLSLDTTAVLLTPMVLAAAGQLKLPALPFAMATVWLANTASLLLPVSNLSNLLALHHLGLSPACTPPGWRSRPWPRWP